MAEKYAVVFDGDARGGKGRSVASLEGSYDNVTSDETGRDYRSITKLLIEQRTIEVDQSEERIKSALATIGIDHYRDLASQRDEVIEQFTHDSLYENEINTTVPLVGREPLVRQAVKHAFKERIRQMVSGDEHDILIVDGRNLGPVVESVEGIDIAIRLFISCTAEEAARRECLRKNIDPVESPDEYERIRRDIQLRKDRDANRPIDKVLPDEDAIDYWFDETLVDAAVEQYLSAQAASQCSARVRKMITSPESYTLTERLGAGALAAKTGRQLLINTTDFTQHDDSLKAMLGVMHGIFKEAMETTGVQLIR